MVSERSCSAVGVIKSTHNDDIFLTKQIYIYMYIVDMNEFIHIEHI